MCQRICVCLFFEAALPVATIYKFGHGVRVDNARATAGAEGGDAECRGASFSSARCVAATVVVWGIAHDECETAGRSRRPGGLRARRHNCGSPRRRL